MGTTVAAIGPSREGRSSYAIAISVEGVQEAARLLEGLDLRASDLTEAWPAVDAAFHAIVGQQAASEGEHGGARWADLARSTQLERARKGIGPAHPELQRTGELLRSLTTLNGDAFSVHHPTYYARGTGVPYFGFLQGGTSRMPARPLVQLTFDDVSALVQPIRVWLTGGDIGRVGAQSGRGAGIAGVGPSAFAQTTGGAGSGTIPGGPG